MCALQRFAFPMSVPYTRSRTLSNHELLQRPLIAFFHPPTIAPTRLRVHTQKPRQLAQLVTLADGIPMRHSGPPIDRRRDDRQPQRRRRRLVSRRQNALLPLRAFEVRAPQSADRYEVVDHARKQSAAKLRKLDRQSGLAARCRQRRAFHPYKT